MSCDEQKYPNTVTDSMSHGRNTASGAQQYLRALLTNYAKRLRQGVIQLCDMAELARNCQLTWMLTSFPPGTSAMYMKCSSREGP